eukprot:2391331-Rhodomonas_salina.1
MLMRSVVSGGSAVEVECCGVEGAASSVCIKVSSGSWSLSDAGSHCGSASMGSSSSSSMRSVALCTALIASSSSGIVM